MSEETRSLLGSQLLKARKGRRLRLVDVAQRSGRQPARISEMEAGKANTTIDTISEVAASLGMTLVLVPIGRLMDAVALSGEAPEPPARFHELPSILQEVFIDDTDPGDDDSGAPSRPMG